MSALSNSRWAAIIALLLVSCSTTPSIAEYPTTLQCVNCQTLRVLRVIDGDTFDTPAGRVRLFGVDTPERGRPCSKQATGWLRGLADNTVRVEPGPRAQDRGGRLLYYVYTQKGNSIDELLIREGVAAAWTRDGQHRDLLVKLARETRQAGTGCLR